MGRKILAVIVGWIAATGVIMIVEMGNSIVVPPPTSDITGDPAKFREFIANLPTKAFVVVLIGYILGSFTGGFIATKMGRRWSVGSNVGSNSRRSANNRRRGKFFLYASRPANLVHGRKHGQLYTVLTARLSRRPLMICPRNT